MGNGEGVGGRVDILYPLSFLLLVLQTGEGSGTGWDIEVFLNNATQGAHFGTPGGCGGGVGGGEEGTRWGRGLGGVLVFLLELPLTTTVKAVRGWRYLQGQGERV